MFDAPSLIKNIPDIAKIYEINDRQIEKLEEDVDQIDSDIMVDTMSDDALKHWEKIYSLSVGDDESLDDRRTKVKGKMLEKLPYTYRVLVRNLDALLTTGYELYVDEDLTELMVKVNLTGKYLISNVEKLLDDMVPLNMVLNVELMYNTYGLLSSFTHGQLSAYTYQDLKDELLDID